MSKTAERRNRELGNQIWKTLRDQGCQCGEFSGWGDSLYTTIYYAKDTYTLRISDHPQPAGGGWSHRKGERHGDHDIQIEIDSGPGAGLAWSDDGMEIINVPHARLKCEDSVPESLKTIIEPIVTEFAELFQRRSEAARKAVETRKAKARERAKTAREKSQLQHRRCHQIAETMSGVEREKLNLLAEAMDFPHWKYNTSNRSRGKKHRVRQAFVRDLSREIGHLIKG